MPTKTLNRTESIIPKIAASINTTSKTQPQSTQKSELIAMKFIWNLPIISLDYLHDNEKTCRLCSKTYDDEFSVCQRGESPCCLPCGHIAGHQCLRAHLSPHESASTKCPFCNDDFPQMFTDPVEPATTLLPPTSSSSSSDNEPETSSSSSSSSEEELSKQLSQLSHDSGISTTEIKRYLSIDEVLHRTHKEEEEEEEEEKAGPLTRARDLAAIGEGEFPKKDRKMAADRRGPVLKRIARRIDGLIARNF